MTVDAPEFRAAAREAVRLAFEDLRTAHAGERFYAYALYTDDGAAGLSPAANSGEGFAAKLAEYGDDAEHGYLRWSTSEWAYEGVGWDRMEAVYQEIGAMGEAANDFDAFRAGVLALMDGVMADLDAEGFFGRGVDREAVTLLCAITDADDSEAFERRTVWALSPSGVAERYEVASLEIL